MKIMTRERKIPYLEYTNTDKWDTVRYCGLLIIYILIMIGGLCYLPEYFTKIGFFLFSIFIFKDVLKRDFDVFKKNWKEYTKYILPRAIVFAVFSWILDNTATYLNGNESINQQELETFSLWYLIPLACVWAPFVEEIIYRGCLRRIIRNDKFFIVLSGFIFGIVHTLKEPTFKGFLIVSIPYVISGLYLAYLYAKTRNMMVNIVNHAILNGYGFVIYGIIAIFSYFW